jgi:23S rRNA (uracil1939-C5)-methyltransferase
MSHEGRGVARVNGKTVFVEGALTGERVRIAWMQRRSTFDEARVVEVMTPSPQREQPGCEHFGVCGGCSLQHMSTALQLEVKQAALAESLARIGQVAPEHWLEPVSATPWGYRRRARLGVKFVTKKNAVLLGFREKRSHLLAELRGCKVLHPAVGERFAPLSALIASLECYNRIPQIEVSVSDQGCALVIRHLVELPTADQERLRAFAVEYGFIIYLQSGGPDTVRPFWPVNPRLTYTLADWQIENEFLPADFTQVNAQINVAMIRLALAQLELTPDEQVLELYCGLGNFTLPIARHAAHVVAVEGEAGLIARARANAGRNGINNVTYCVQDLNEVNHHDSWNQPGRYQKVLLDPPRTGAIAAVGALGKLAAARIVYVSCNPATLARDAAVLVHEQGYMPMALT